MATRTRNHAFLRDILVDYMRAFFRDHMDGG